MSFDFLFVIQLFKRVFNGYGLLSIDIILVIAEWLRGMDFLLRFPPLVAIGQALCNLHHQLLTSNLLSGHRLHQLSAGTLAYPI